MSRGVKRLGHKETRDMARRLKPGYSFRSEGGGGKFRLVAPDGSLVRNHDGIPVVIPNSPSSRFVIANLRRELQALGVMR